ncbi:MAG: DegT/DnrJ/EryC1/StrS family aminotransferase [Gemmatimonadota bacterium]|nr:DegT/DnrJ/EryC1/StrS family aminotransferase [Gemmatimonadota bacterium]
MKKIEFFKHNIGRREIRDVNRVLRGLFLTTGRQVELFEGALARYLGMEYAVGVTSCTAALQLSLTALGVGPDDEVITTPMSFIATAMAILQAGAKPVFVDVEPGTGNLDAGLIKSALTPRTRAVLPVHLYGQLCDMRRIREAADRYGLVVVEDAAHALEADRDGIAVGHLGDAACFSFYPTKSITCGEGGAVAVATEELALKLKAMRHHGMSRTAAERYQKDDPTYEVTMMGWKYNMDNIQAALLTGQLERVEKFLDQRQRLAALYRNSLEGVPGIELLAELPESRHSYHLFCILVPARKRMEFVAWMNSRGIGVSITYPPIHMHRFFRERFGFRQGMFPVAEDLGSRVVTLPIYPKLKMSEARHVVRNVKQAAARLKFED